MKFLIVLVDGAADQKIESLGGITPLEAAQMPNINQLAQKGEVGLVSTIPKGISPGSDTANLSVMGYDPAVYHTGRSPLEAVSMGLELSETDIAFRCNLVTLTNEDAYDDKIILDHSSGDISSQEAAILIEAINNAFGNDLLQFYPGISYRHAMILKAGSTDFELMPPHDILTQKIRPYLPTDERLQFIRKMMRESYKILSSHPVNINRRKMGLREANSIWIWGQGRKPRLSSFYDKYKVRGAVISAVDLIKGIGLCAGLSSIDVPGATGTLHTNYSGKAEAAMEAFKAGADFIYIHIEAPDECSHQGDLPGKIKSIEEIDEKIVKPLSEFLAATNEPYRILVLPDHPTPMALRTHTSDPVPFVLYDSQKTQGKPDNAFTEKSGAGGSFFANGYELTDHFFNNSNIR